MVITAMKNVDNTSLPHPPLASGSALDAIARALDVSSSILFVCLFVCLLDCLVVWLFVRPFVFS